MHYPNKLKHYRTKQNLTQQEVITLLGHTSTSRLSTWEQGTALPSIPNILKLAQLYKVPVERLYKPSMPKHKKSALVSLGTRPDFFDPQRPPDDCTEDEALEYLAGILVDIFYEKGLHE